MYRPSMLILFALVPAFVSAQAAEAPPMWPPVGGAPQPSASAPGAIHRVQFVPDDPERAFTVQVDDGALTCKTPCELDVGTGNHRVTISGDASFYQHVDVGGPTTVKVEKRNTGRMVLGIVSVAVGVNVALVGLSLMAESSGGSDSVYTESDRDSMRSVGRVALIGGALVATVGGVAGFSSIGHTRLTVEPAQPLADRSDRGIRLVGLGIAPVRDGGAMLGAAFAF